MAFLLDHLPPRLHVVIATRADPPLPLARLRARGELTEVRARGPALHRRTRPPPYLNEAMGLGLADGDVAALEARTEGWIAALQLAALSMRGPGGPGGVHRGVRRRRPLRRRLPRRGGAAPPGPERVRELPAADVRPRPAERPAVRRRHRAAGDGQAMLETLERGNLFLVPLDDRRQWYRYHHLFADVLHAHLMGRAARTRSPSCTGGRAPGSSSTAERADAIGHALAGKRLRRGRGPDRAGDPGDGARPGRRPRCAAGWRRSRTTRSASGRCSASALAGATADRRRPRRCRAPAAGRPSGGWRSAGAAGAAMVVADEDEYRRLPGAYRAVPRRACPSPAATPTPPSGTLGRRSNWARKTITSAACAGVRACWRSRSWSQRRPRRAPYRGVGRVQRRDCERAGPCQPTSSGARSPCADIRTRAGSSRRDARRTCERALHLAGHGARRSCGERRTCTWR